MSPNGQCASWPGQVRPWAWPGCAIDAHLRTPVGFPPGHPRRPFCQNVCQRGCWWGVDQSVKDIGVQDMKGCPLELTYEVCSPTARCLSFSYFQALHGVDLCMSLARGQGAGYTCPRDDSIRYPDRWRDWLRVTLDPTFGSPGSLYLCQGYCVSPEVKMLSPLSLFLAKCQENGYG